MAVAARVPSPLHRAVPAQARDVDQRVILHGISWRDYCVLRDLLDDSAVRMTYLEGALEIMSPSRLHEDVKTRIARLLELFALERDVRVQGYGSMTLRHEPKERGLEPDECYVIGPPQTEGFPDLAVEVCVTSGGIDKLEVYRGFGVREVWIWVEGRIVVYGLTGADYVETRDERSPSRYRPRRAGSICRRAGPARGCKGVSGVPARREALIATRRVRAESQGPWLNEAASRRL